MSPYSRPDHKPTYHEWRKSILESHRPVSQSQVACEGGEFPALFSGGIAPAPTVADRLERIELELDAIRREAA